MVFRPLLSRLIPLSLLAAILALLGIDAALVVGMARVGVGLMAFVAGALLLLSLPALAVLVYWLWGALSLRYAMDRNAVRIHWAATTHVIPLPNITAIEDGADFYVERVHGYHWPGLLVGLGHLDRLGSAVICATRPLPEQLILVTRRGRYAVSPADRVAFIEALGTRQRLGPTEALAETAWQPRWMRLPIWRDRLVYALFGAGIVLSLLLWAWVSLLYGSLPASLPMRGIAATPLARAIALWLPLAGAAALVVNSTLAVAVHRRERFAAYLSLGSAVAVQVFIWIALLHAVL
ncbi:MAG: PH domain-containing protein [Anaerolineae bacterium]